MTEEQETKLREMIDERFDKLSGTMTVPELAAYIEGFKHGVEVVGTISIEIAATRNKPQGQAPVPGGLIGSAGVPPSGSSFRKYVPTLDDTDRGNFGN